MNIRKKRSQRATSVRKTLRRDSTSSVQSLAKAFRLLEAIAATDRDLTLSELAGVAALDPGTTHRMLNTLVNLGYVERSEGKRFALTLKVLDLGFRAPSAGATSAPWRDRSCARSSAR